MSESVDFYCEGTSAEPHGRIDIGRVVKDGAGLREHGVRRRANRQPPGTRIVATFGDERVEQNAPTRIVDVAPTIREDYEGRARWRLRCSKCGIDRPLSVESMQAIFDAVVAAGRRAVNVSLLPR